MGFPIYNTAGQSVQNSPDIASGYYLLSDAEIAAMNAAGTNPCGPTGIRTGFIHIRGVGRINTCAGRILTEDLPDIYLVNSHFRIWMLVVLTGAVVVLGFFAGREFLRWKKR